MVIRKPKGISPAEITPYEVYLDRRRFIGQAARLAAATAVVGGPLAACDLAAEETSGSFSGDGMETYPRLQGETLTPKEDVTSYNNFYEFGTGKDDPAKNARDFQPRPWTVKIDGHCENPGEYDLDDLMGRFPSQERIYRLRCVEAWSMVIPWQGFPLKDLLEWVQPTSRARFVEFTTLFDPDRMPGQRSGVLDWPYVEGLRMDEALNPLTLMATGLYDETLPGQNGAPIRLVVPWKYGFKSIKSIVRIRLVNDMPRTTWNLLAPREYGFFANVNPEVDHPRWSQARERRIGEIRRRATLPFNGYGQEVASLYEGMDLQRWF